jgi:type II secretory pathway pseudopilin PulG
MFLNFKIIRERENQMIKLKKDIKRCREKRNIKSKSDRAITLIALIVTIIVLLILAGVTIANVMGNQGVIKKAKIATSSYETASCK